MCEQQQAQAREVELTRWSSLIPIKNCSYDRRLQTRNSFKMDHLGATSTAHHHATMHAKARLVLAAGDAGHTHRCWNCSARLENGYLGTFSAPMLNNARYCCAGNSERPRQAFCFTHWLIARRYNYTYYSRSRARRCNEPQRHQRWHMQVARTRSMEAQICLRSSSVYTIVGCCAGGMFGTRAVLTFLLLNRVSRFWFHAAAYGAVKSK
jgi:hypothetical protein